MADSPYIFDVTQHDFAQAVLENSHRVPVLVDFWAAWCGPCQMLMPMLAKLVEEYGGKVLLAKVNSDEQQALASHFGVRSLPTVKLFKDGRVVDEFMGVQPEPVIRQMLERHVPRESDTLRTRARGLAEAGDYDAAEALLKQAADMDPGHYPIHLDLVALLLEQGKAEAAATVLEALPVNVRQEDAAKALEARLRFARVAQGAPERTVLERRIEADPADLEARYTLAALYVAGGEFEPGMEQLLEIMRRDRKFRDDGGRQGLLAVFEMLGGSGDLVTRYRRQMFNLMH